MNGTGKRSFTLSELKEFDGKEGRPAFIALRGKVYNVSESMLWKEGKHQGVHSPGSDLTESIKNAPHDEEVLSRFPVVGKLNREDPSKKKLVQKIEKLHVHPMLIHFPIAYFMVVSLLSLLYLFIGKLSLETASYYMLALGFLSGPFAIFSGFFTWKVTYRGNKTKIFFRKIQLSSLLIIIVTACFLWRTLDPHILIEKTALSYIYLIMIISLAPVVAILGHYGGKIVYSS